MYGYWGDGWWGGIDWDFGMDLYMLPDLTWITNKDLLYSTGKMAQYHVTAEMEKAFEKEQIHVYV